jgi:Cu-processing system ATP-binding protein
MITIEEVTKNYGAQRVLGDVSLSFSPGESVALIGPNGSGKTTLIKTILSLVRPDRGTISVNEQDVSLGGDYRSAIGYMPQMTRFPENMNVRQLFQLIQDLRPDVAKEDYDLDLYRVYDIEKMESKKLHALSGGMKQKVSAALAFLFSPDILILDEPTAGLDPVSNERLKDKIRQVTESQKLVLITSHILSDLDEIVNKVVYLIDGQIAFHKTLDQLREETSETRLNKIIVTLLHQMDSHVENN